MPTLTEQLGTLTQSVDTLTAAVNVKKAVLDAAVIASQKERRHAWSAPYSYCGVASDNSLESAAVWIIKRIAVANDGSTTITTATNVAWTNRATATYT